MKKIINYSGIPALILMAALFFLPVSCNKDTVKDNPNADNSSQLIKVSGEDANTATKTTLNGLETSWKADDKVGIYSPQARTQASGAGDLIVNAQFTAANSGVSSNFTGTMYWSIVNEPHTFYAYYPYAGSVGSPTATAVPVSLATEQTQSAVNNSDHIGALDFMVATPVTVTSLANIDPIANTVVSLRYNHVFTVLEFQIKGSGILKAVKLSGSSTLAFSGGTIDITKTTPTTDISYTIADQTGTNQVVVTLGTQATLTPTNTDTKVYMVINPGTQTGNCLIGLYDGTTWTYISKEAPVMTSDPLVRGFLRGKKYVVAIDKVDASTVPVLTTIAASAITTTTATSGGNITSDGGSGITARGVCWSTLPSPTIVLNSKTTDGSGTGIFTSSIIGLTAGTTYYVRAYATNSIGTAYGDQLTLTAATVPGAPTIGTATAGNALAVVAFTAPVSDGGSAITEYTVTSSPDGKTVTGSTSPITVTGLTNGTAYTFTVTATNAIGTSVASSASNSVTPSTVPVLTTTAATSITQTTATSGGNITSDGGAAVTARGVCWSTFTSPTILLNSKTTDDVGTGAFTSSITELTAGTVYYVRAYATNSAGTSYGNEVTFTTATVPGAPTIGTATAGNAQATVTFTAPGSNGGSAITGYTATSTPGSFTGTLTQAGSGTITVTGLANGTAYTFTVKATNAIGTSAASSASNSVTPVTPVPTVTNPTTTKIWMDRNLGATQVATSSTDAAAYGDLYQWGRGSDGHQSRSSLTTTTLATDATSTPSNAWYGLFIKGGSDWLSSQNDNLWQGVSGVNNPCPSGFRIPTKAELDAELASWGSSPNATGAFGSLLKLPVAGYRDGGLGSFYGVGTNARYWSSTVNVTNSYYLYFSINDAGTSSSNNRAFGYSVRCIKE